MGKDPAVPKALRLSADPESTLGSEGIRLAKKQIKKIEELVPATLAGDVEAIHDMRIATRRLRALIRLKREYADDKALKSAAKFAKSLGRLLGEVRAEDVLLLRLRELEQSDAVRGLIIGVTYRRAIRAEQLGDLVASKSFHKKLRDIEEAMSNWKDVKEDFHELAANSIRREYARVKRHKGITAHAAFDKVHALRIDAKKFRYTLEFFGRATTWNTVPVLLLLGELQDSLGDIHDEDVLCRELHAASQMTRLWSDREVQEFKGLEAAVRQSVFRKLAEAPSKWDFLFAKEFARNIEG